MGLSRFFRRSYWDDERRNELQDYLAHEIDDNIARGMTPAEAAAAAHRQLGNVTQIREDIYHMNTLRFLETLWQDFRYGFRLLRKNPTFATVAILTLALGTGANAAIFQLVNSVRLRALPISQPDGLVTLVMETSGKGRTGRFMSRRPFYTEPLYAAIKAEQQAFSQVFAFGITSWNIGTGGEYQPVQGLYVSGNYFEALGVKPHHGRLLAETDDVKDCAAPGAVLTHGFWQARYGGDRSAVGQRISLDGRQFDIVGITPPGFFGVEVGRSFDVAIPICGEPLIRGEQSAIGKPAVWFLDLMGRLKDDWTIEKANAHLAAISAGIFQSTLPPQYNPETAKTYLAFKLTAKDGSTGVSGLRTAYKTQMWVLLAATGLVLLVTCANLANLILARATAREREIAVRLAIGASRKRIIRQMLSESFLIAGLGAVGGALISRWLSQTLVTFLSTSNVRLFVDLTPDWRVFLFIAGLAVLACLLFGLTPAVKATGSAPVRSMQSGGRSATDSRERFAMRRALVVVQVALSLVLVVGALLFMRSLRNLVTLDPGFRQEGILSVNVDVRRSGIDPAALAPTYTQIMERIRATPGVLHAAEAFMTPLSGSGWNQSVIVDGVKMDGHSNFNRVGPDFFTAMETPLIAGRTFGAQDRLGATETAIVNQTFARKYFAGQNPIGRTFQMEMAHGEPRPHYHVIGVAKDTKYTELREDFTPIAYLAASQETEVSPYLDLIVRTDLPASAIAPTLTRAAREVAPNSTVAIDSLRTYVRDALVTERVMATLAAFFGGLAMLIATIGLYGVISYTVSRRKVEIGVRMALGADPGKVVRMVLGESSLLLITGVIIGTALAIWLSRWAAALLFDLQPWDPLSLAGAVGLLAAVSLFAAWLPARRASNLTPTIALREE